MVALIAHAYRLGQHSGYSQGFDTAMNQRLSERDLLTVEYPIDSVIEKAFPNEHADYAVADLLKLVAEKAKPETWESVGGYGTLDARCNEHGEHLLIVTNSIPVHLEISRILDDLRGAAIGIRDRSLVKKFYETQSQTPVAE